MSLNKRSRVRLPHKEYKQLCLEVMERDGWKCKCPGCNSRNSLHCHHIVYRSDLGDDAAYNLLTLCDPCHKALHDRYWFIKPLVPNTPYNASDGLLFEFIGSWRPGKVMKFKDK